MQKDSDKNQEHDMQTSPSQADKKNWLEWMVFAFGLLCVLGILGYLGYQVYTRKPSSPELYVQSWPDPAASAPNRYHILLENRGGSTAEEVIIELSLLKAGQEVEKAELQISFAPQESKREGWVGFKNNPSQADTLIARVVSYKKP